MAVSDVQHETPRADERKFARSAFELIGAIAAVQLLYWLVIFPAIFAPSPSVEKIAISRAAVAILASPDVAALQQARFQPVTLPWDGCCEAGYRAVRMHFELSRVPEDGLGLVPLVGSDNFRIYVNNALFYSVGELRLPAISYNGNVRSTFRIPPALLHVGENRLDFVLVRDAGTPYFSVAPPAIGNFDEISRAYLQRNESLGSYLTMSQGIGFAAAFVAFILWLRSNRDPAIFWMAVLCGAWSLRIMHHRMVYPPFHGELRIIFLYLYVNLAPLALLNFANHWSGSARKWISWTSIWAFLIVMTVAGTIIQFGLFQKIDTADRVSMGFVLMMSAAALALFVGNYTRSRERRHFEVAVFVLCCTLFAADAISTLFDLSYGDHVKRALPVVLLGFVAPFFAKNVRLFRSMSEFNELLQNQLDERTVELEQAHARERDLVRAQAHQNERQRIMRDMHDGLGSQLMSMLLAARRGESEPAAVAEGLQSVIDEMRLLIDSMDSVGESLAAAFATFRERIEPRVETAGMRFIWQDTYVGALPKYGPRQVLQVFRIMQEAMTNALKHAKGSTLTMAVSNSPREGHALRVSIIDDGDGIKTANPRGKGMASMAARASELGGVLSIQPGESGTVVQLDLPPLGDGRILP